MGKNEDFNLTSLPEHRKKKFEEKIKQKLRGPKIPSLDVVVIRIMERYKITREELSVLFKVSLRKLQALEKENDIRVRVTFILIAHNFDEMVSEIRKIRMKKTNVIPFKKS